MTLDRDWDIDRRPAEVCVGLVDAEKITRVPINVLRTFEKKHWISFLSSGLGTHDTYSLGRAVVVKAFCIKVLYDEEEERDPGKRPQIIYEKIEASVKKLSPNNGLQRFLSREDWKQATERAEKLGMSFIGTVYAYRESNT